MLLCIAKKFVIPRRIEAYSFSLPFGYIFPSVKSRAKAFRFPRKQCLRTVYSWYHEQKIHQKVVFCTRDPTGNRTPNSAVTGLHYSRLTMRPLLWRQWESNPPHFPCKGESPSLGTCVPIFFHQHVKEHSLNQHHKVTKLFPFRQALKQKNPPF